MKVLLDTCVWGGVRQALSDAGYDAVWTGDWDEDPGDDQILAHAYREDRVLVTLDKDFGILAFLHGRPHAGILRLVNLSTQQQAVVCLRVLDQHGLALQAGAVLTAELDRVRIRQPGSGAVN
jgi:predicted nuclease of predicted toxin-antitoxin system